LSDEREFDLVLQGATGFTGRLAAAELCKRAPQGLRLAISGRSRERTEALAERLGLPALVTPGLDADATDDLAARSRVVLSCAGPFSRYGTLLVDACARHGTHYADLSGELVWIREMIDRHHKTCSDAGVTLIPASGFDSVPTDLGVQALLSDLGESLPVTGFFAMRGGLNGGTLYSGIALAEEEDPRAPIHPHLLDPDPEAALAATPRAIKRPAVFPIPGRGRWSAPFLMAPVNERVVRRSAALLAEEGAGYGAGFRYDESLLCANRFHAHGMRSLLGIAGQLLASPAGRWALGRFGPSPGQGPSARSIEQGFARLTLVAGALDAPVATRTFSWRGDPSNAITVNCLVQTGLALAAGEARRGGVVTAASALGSRLLERLAGVQALTWF